MAESFENPDNILRDWIKDRLHYQTLFIGDLLLNRRTATWKYARLLSTKEAQESHEAIAECDSSFSKVHIYLDGRTDALLPFLL